MYSIISSVNCDLLQVGVKLNSVSPSDFYYDMEYCVDYSTFRSLVMGKQFQVLDNKQLRILSFWNFTDIVMEIDG